MNPNQGRISMKETGASCCRQMIFIWFPVVPEIQSTVQESQKTYPASAAQIYSQMLRVSLKAMAFRHLGNSPVAIPMEIKKNSLFWRTTACRTGSRTPFLRLTLKTQASTFKTAEVSSNSFCARTMALWLRAKLLWHGWSLHQTLWKQNFRMAFRITLIWLAVSLGLQRLPEPVGSPSLVSLKSHGSWPLWSDLGDSSVQTPPSSPWCERRRLFCRIHNVRHDWQVFSINRTDLFPHRAAFIWARHLQGSEAPWIY